MRKKFTETFAMKAIPFGKNVEPETMFSYPQIEELHQKLDLAVESSSAMLVTGQAGTGKTTAVRVFLDGLPRNRYRVIYLGYDQTGSSLFSRLASEFGLRLTGSGSRILQLSNYIKRHVTGSHRELILVVDEAHLLDYRTLEDIRLLTNSEMDRASAMVLVMIGQLWLRTKLKSLGHEALYQRLRFRFGLEGLSKKQTQSYIAHHLAQVGVSANLFTEGAVGQIFQASGGILREINNLSIDCMLKAGNLGLPKVDEKLVKLVIDQREVS